MHPLHRMKKRDMRQNIFKHKRMEYNSRKEFKYRIPFIFFGNFLFLMILFHWLSTIPIYNDFDLYKGYMIDSDFEKWYNNRTGGTVRK